ncbi:phytoene desaturase family protein [Vulgatibacter sp.]|uniref:phytoene desaturase family protein n=1 Tax=Vulgatibacter sp. TaxID=1971226 RepID=UPI00356A284C
MPPQIAVVGGGLAGLTAATLLAREGAAVTLFERAPQPGGRAASTLAHGFSLNFGAHALYLGGPGARLLRRLGVELPGGPPPKAPLALRGGELVPLPAGFGSLLSTPLLGWGGKWELSRTLSALLWRRAAAHDGESLAGFLAALPVQGEVRALLAAIFRLSTYAADAERLSAGAAIRQLQIATRGNLRYLDGGWQALVDRLAAKAEAAGVRLVAGCRVEAVEHEGRVRALRLADGTRLPFDAAVIATGPAAAAALLGGARWPAPTPVHAACLDLGLARLPEPSRLFALGIDAPLYVGVHASARLAPEGGAVVHVARYLLGEEQGDEAGLELALDRLQPGWRDHVVERRFLPRIVVSHGLPLAAQGGAAGRPAGEVAGIENLRLAGDWVGPEGMLSDASFSSAAAAAAALAGSLARERRAS